MNWPQKYILTYCQRINKHICVIKTNLVHYVSSVYFVSQPLHVSGMFVAHHQEVYYIYIYIYIQQLVRVVLERGMFKIT